MGVVHHAVGLCLAALSILLPNAVAQQHSAGMGSLAPTTPCHLRLQALAGDEPHLDQLKLDALPEVIREVDTCVGSSQLTRADLANAYKARSNVQSEIDRRSGQQDEDYKTGAGNCFVDLRPAVAEVLKPLKDRFQETSDESLQKQQTRAAECMKSFGRDDKARLAAYLAYDAVQVERFYRIALKFDKSVRDVADRYNTDTAQLSNKLIALRQEYIDHLDQDIRTYNQVRKQQRAEERAEALAAWSRALSSTPAPVSQSFQAPKPVHCTTQTIPPAVPGMSGWAYTTCY